MNISIFEVLGPVMIGPSSSHTAGAARLARVAAGIVGQPFDRVDFLLSGSFAHTYVGHGTDRALLAGAMGLREDDERIVNAFTLAQERGLKYAFIPTEMPDAPDNAAEMRFYAGEKLLGTVLGASVGGGRIRILAVDGTEAQFSAETPTIILRHRDAPGVVSAITAALSRVGVNIAVMQVNRDTRGGTATTIIETDEAVWPATAQKISAVENVLSLRVIDV